MVFDLFMVDKRYVNNNPDQFRSAREVDMPFNATEADQRILADTTHFRVFEVEGGMSSARTSFFINLLVDIMRQSQEECNSYSITKSLKITYVC